MLTEIEQLQNHRWTEKKTGIIIELPPHKHLDIKEAFNFYAFNTEGRLASKQCEYYRFQEDKDGRAFITVKDGQNRYFNIRNDNNGKLLVLSDFNGNQIEYIGECVL